MTRRITNILKIVVFTACAHTTLRSRRSVIRTRFFACEHIFKLHHPCISEQQGRVIARNQWTRRHDGVPIFLKIFKELRTDFSAFHGFSNIWNSSDVQCYRKIASTASVASEKLNPREAKNRSALSRVGSFLLRIHFSSAARHRSDSLSSASSKK